MGEVPVVGGHPGEIRPVSSYLPLCCIPGQGGLLRPLRTLGRVDAHVNMPSQISQVGFFLGGGGECKKTSRLIRSATLTQILRILIAPCSVHVQFSHSSGICKLYYSSCFNVRSAVNHCQGCKLS